MTGGMEKSDRWVHRGQTGYPARNVLAVLYLNE